MEGALLSKINVTVNGQTVNVENGANLIDALKESGLHIPHFCYHPALGDDGNCRMCLVTIDENPNPVLACKTTAKEGMTVVYDSEKIKQIQHAVLELMLINHPTDCPVCDQAGDCGLQDYYMKYGLESSRFTYDKVHKSKTMNFGGNVMHNQDRCILCRRCVRFFDKITQTSELAVVNRGDRSCVDLFPGKKIDNPYGMNVVDLCPIGALTSKDFRFTQRSWFLEKAKSVCRGCAKGCSIWIDHNKEKYKDDVIYRYRPRHNDQVNGWFICDEGRLSYKRENDNILTKAYAKNAESTVDNAITGAGSLLRTHKGNLTFVISPDLTLQEMQTILYLAILYKAEITGYSDAYMSNDFGDEFLKKDDRAANRAGLVFLGIDQSKPHFESTIAASDVICIFGSNIFERDASLNETLKNKQTILISPYELDQQDRFDFLIPCAGYTEVDGHTINCDNVLQYSEKALFRNKERMTIQQIADEMSGRELKIELVFLSGDIAEACGVERNKLMMTPENGVQLQGADK